MRASHNFSAYNNGWTRGGPSVKLPSEASFNIFAYTDSREKIIGNVFSNYAYDANGTQNYNIGLDTQWKPSTQIDISFGPEYSRRQEKRQWVDSFEDPTAVNTYGSRYVFANIDQKTISGNIRMNWTFTPQLSLQLFLQPLFAVGSYSNYDNENDEYIVNPDINSNAEEIRIENPDFNFKSLRGNLVLRYEMLPGTILYLVWSHDRSNDADAGNFNFKRDFTNLWKAETNDIFLLKFSYWLNI